MIYVHLAIYENTGDLDQLIAVCDYPQYDYPLDQLEKDIHYFQTEVARRIHSTVGVKINKDDERSYSIYLVSKETPINPGSTRRAMNQICEISKEYFYKEHPQ